MSVDNIPSFPMSVFIGRHVYSGAEPFQAGYHCVMALTTMLEAQHSAAQTTIQTLESKVEALEGMLKIAEEALKAKTLQEEEAKEMANQEVQAKEKEEKHEKESLMEMLAEWKESVERQWGHVREEWKEERERLNKAREEWEAKLGALTSANASSDAHVIGNGDVFKHNGLVNPPSLAKSIVQFTPISQKTQTSILWITYWLEGQVDVTS